MSTFLFDKIVFGPVQSRRLGTSLGINLLPVNAKICTFNCQYCECGFNFKPQESHIPSRNEVKNELRNMLSEMKADNKKLDVITFAGNGEPTMHTDFASIVDDTIALRNEFFPDAKISVLSNSTLIHKPTVFDALNKVDNNILKMDSAIDTTIHLLNQPGSSSFSAKWLIEHLKRFNGNLILQTLFLQGEIDGKHIDNTTAEEIKAWLNAIQEIRPKQVMIYTLARDTPAQTLKKATYKQLNEIAGKVKALHIEVSVSE
ncbi:MAG: putative Fe-S oxidoreductase [Bacteroidetes bacterium]|jgi:wyosine [tRNA(Phe)-imidazoG37] synthetase (radical SAM superfamily)|nr:putative Fe-S oxidoreductase [Bacteroidota bacterium]